MFTDTKKASEAGSWIHIKNEGRKMYADDGTGNADESKPVRIKILGPHSPTLQKRMASRNAQRLKDRGGIIDMSKMGIAELEAMFLDGARAVAENWSDATIAWENMPGDIGDFERYKAEKLYFDFPDLPEQIAESGADIKDFLRLARAS